MPFNKANWANGGNMQGAPAMHRYSTSDTAATVDTTGYFNAVADEVRVGDVILAATGVGGTLATGLYQVRSISSGVVDVADALVIPATNTD
jgi:hypothetical protein